MMLSLCRLSQSFLSQHSFCVDSDFSLLCIFLLWAFLSLCILFFLPFSLSPLLSFFHISFIIVFCYFHFAHSSNDCVYTFMLIFIIIVTNKGRVVHSYRKTYSCVWVRLSFVYMCNVCVFVSVYMEIASNQLYQRKKVKVLNFFWSSA